MALEHFDVLIVGAGISGIGAACHLQKNCPGKTYLIVEARAAPGGTWDLFRYPGIRSDSDMYTLGYAFKPWTHPRAIADAPQILDYLKETVAEHQLEPHMRYGHKVVSAKWSTARARWEVEIEQQATGDSILLSCDFLHMCSGYYNYEHGYMPEFEGTECFNGPIIHPQHWPEGLDYQGKRMVVIGSGATAVTLVPALAKTAAHVTMLQRSPTYVVSRPAEDRFANKLREILPPALAYFITRWRNILFQRFIYERCRKYPRQAKARIIAMVRDELGPQYDVDTHFTPTYYPWDQRLCLVPDGDMFKAIREGRASVVTDHIDCFTGNGLRLKSGKELQADIIVTATGLELQFLSDVVITVDGEVLEPGRALSYKGMMVSGVPNMALSAGYTNASWTLKCDLTCDYVCRLLNYMDRHGYRICTPVNRDPNLEVEAYMSLSSGYIQRALDKFPRQGARAPWKLYQNYIRDIFALRFGRLADGVMEFSR